MFKIKIVLFFYALEVIVHGQQCVLGGYFRLFFFLIYIEKVKNTLRVANSKFSDSAEFTVGLEADYFFVCEVPENIYFRAYFLTMYGRPVNIILWD